MKQPSKIFPISSSISDEGHLTISGYDTVTLAAEYGTPLYVFSEEDIRGRCREFATEFHRNGHHTRIVFAGKALLNIAILKIIAEAGLGLDTVSGGELEIASAAEFPMEKVYLHGNNKSDSELELALEKGVGRIVIDNPGEMFRLNRLAEDRGAKPKILFRIRPGIDPHTHAKISTGNIDSKFGFSLNEAMVSVPQAMALKNVEIVGFHYHIGSQIFEIQPFLDAMTTTLEFISEMQKVHGFVTQELDAGGGFAVQYLSDQKPPDIGVYAEAILGHFDNECGRLKIVPPGLTIEPGRGLIARAAVALYTVGVIKEIPEIRNYVCVDGGMADNIRPSLYGAAYEPYLANRMNETPDKVYTVAGRYCESGDILATDIELPAVKSGDVIVVPVCGAYCLPMASNYNGSLKPAVVMVHKGQARLIRRREVMADLLRCDIN
ncbi:MAG: diaminopimelate decarboxylase [Dehalogenimonas sp.]|uniref:Diaminopimelate decarboxylase n=1 Tax=Candidatus Dehalogenimonas loeffleri TaxID=3127115 RepID=A0ABZ2J2U3_9CHLR|nr:diaminopimelate decarboxylase [Dehalogenimonas sp.]